MSNLKVWTMTAAVGALVLAGCATDGTSTSGGSSGRGFEKSYFQARSALENRNYATAIRRYNGLLQRSGPLESRMRLELAHAYLRADEYGDASREARIVAAAHQDARRAAALAVYGTAEHRLAQDAMSRGDFGAGTQTHLRAADRAFAEMLDSAPDLDPLGTLAERYRMVQASLKDSAG